MQSRSRRSGRPRFENQQCSRTCNGKSGKATPSCNVSPYLLKSAVLHFQIGEADCYKKCSRYDRYLWSGACAHCDGYCCRTDEKNNKCTKKMLKAIENLVPTNNKHYCVSSSMKEVQDEFSWSSWGACSKS